MSSLGTLLLELSAGSLCVDIYTIRIESYLTRTLLLLTKRPYALISGSTDGIGLSVTHNLAAQSFNLILHARNRSKVQRLIDKLTESYPNQDFQAIIADASDHSCWREVLEQDLGRILADRNNRRLTVLVNNIGGSPDPSNPYASLSDRRFEDVDAYTNINATFPAHLTRAALPYLQSNTPSLILTVSSVVALEPMPYLTLYSPGKAHIHSLTLCLRAELQAEGFTRGSEKGDIEVLVVTAAKVQTPGAGSIDTSFFVPSSDAFVKAMLDKVGCGYGVVAGYWTHALQIWFINILPLWLKEQIVISAVQEEKKALVARAKKR